LHIIQLIERKKPISFGNPRKNGYFCGSFVFLFIKSQTRMKDKSNRLLLIKDLIRNNRIGSQEELLNLLQEHHFELTQATLSRDLKQLKVAKMPDQDGTYVYLLPEDAGITRQTWVRQTDLSRYTASGFLSIDFCGVFAVVKTKPGYSGSIAADIDQKTSSEILGTIAGDDTILIIPREHVSRADLLRVLADVLPIQ
jgi:transcriptional regulator of arginine metabolism